jgi:hypothetical protein
MTNGRLLGLLVAASTLGGTIGSLATAATQSDASPQAIAAAVQKVRDSGAEQTLRSIESRLGSVEQEVAQFHTDSATAAVAITQAVKRASTYAGQDASALYLQLLQICRNTASGSTYCVANTSPPIR